MTDPSELFGRAFEALDAEDFDAVTELLEAAREAGVDASDARLRFFELMSGWLSEDLDEDRAGELFEQALALLEDAVDLEDPRDAALVTINVAEIVAFSGDVDEAEHALRALSERGDLDDETAGDARLAWARVLLDDQDDPEEALAVLEGASDSLLEDSAYASLLAAVYMELDRGDEAVELLEDALEREDETELRYQLGVILRVLDQPDAALDQLLEVRRRDLDSHEIDLDAEIDGDEAVDLQRYLEDLLETLPDAVLKSVATAAIRVERWPSEAAVREGCDPRTALAFEGEPETDDDDGRVDALVIYRDALITAIEHDDEIIDTFAVCLAEEFDRFFDFELIPGM